MAIRPIRVLGMPGDEVLREPAASIQTIDGSIQTLVDDMLATMVDEHGVGLAAPQVGVPLRLLVIGVHGIPPFALINGEVVRHSGSRWVEEGCLSIPGYRGELFRSVRVAVRGLDRQGRRVYIRAADDLLAQALEHEIDHTNGLLYIDRIVGAEHMHRIDRARQQDAPEVLEEETAGAVPPIEAIRRRRHGAPPLFVTRRTRFRTPAPA